MKFLEFKGEGVAVKPITVFLHGFPGVRSKQNRDIAESVAKTTGRLCYVPLYPGLGFSEGEFSFRACQKIVAEFVAEMLKRHGQIDLVGHSWGGYQSLALAAAHGQKIGHVVLMSPLLHFFDARVAGDSFAETASNNPQLQLGNTEELAKEFVGVGTSTLATDLAKQIDPLTKVTILQAKTDDVTPASHAEALLSRFNELPIYKVIDTDHSFVLNREFATEEIIRALEMDQTD